MNRVNGGQFKIWKKGKRDKGKSKRDGERERGRERERERDRRRPAPQAIVFWRVLARRRATSRDFSAGFHHFIPSRNNLFEGHMFEKCTIIVATG